MSAISEGLAILGAIILVMAVIAASAILGTALSVFGILFLMYLGIRGLLEL